MQLHVLNAGARKITMPLTEPGSATSDPCQKERNSLSSFFPYFCASILLSHISLGFPTSHHVRSGQKKEGLASRVAFGPPLKSSCELINAVLCGDSVRQGRTVPGTVCTKILLEVLKILQNMSIQRGILTWFITIVPQPVKDNLEHLTQSEPMQLPSGYNHFNYLPMW